MRWSKGARAVGRKEWLVRGLVRLGWGISRAALRAVLGAECRPKADGELRFGQRSELI